MHIEYWWERQKERDNWEDQDVGVDNIKNVSFIMQNNFNVFTSDMFS
jgi:hypothetical protein